MTLDIEEKKLLYAYGCPVYSNTIRRLRCLAAMTVDPMAQHQALELTRKMEREANEALYHDFYLALREEMDEYYRALRRVRQLETHTMYMNENDYGGINRRRLKEEP